MERQILMIVVILSCIYLVGDSMIGSKKYINRFIKQIIPEWNPPSVVETAKDTINKTFKDITGFDNPFNGGD